MKFRDASMLRTELDKARDNDVGTKSKGVGYAERRQLGRSDFGQTILPPFWCLISVVDYVNCS
jgi:hypothetical protein